MDRVWALGRRLTKPMPPVGTTPATVVHHENKWRLLRYDAPDGVRWKTPVLLVPSLINRHYVLDLMPDKSFAGWLAKRGHDVYCIDWGTPTDEDRFITFEDIADKAIGRAARVACKLSGAPRAHLLGYCLGGTLTIVHAAIRPEHVQSLVLLAAPVGFHDEGLLSLWTRTQSFDVRALVNAMGNVPWQLMQSAFHMLRPTMTASKAVTLLDKAWDDEFLDGMFALETWGNDNVSFPGACYETYIEELYRKDGLLRGSFTLGANHVRLSNVTAPTLAVTFEHDAIVPHRSASIVLERIGASDKQHLHLPGGHVGAVVSKKAKDGLWPAMAKFWEARQTS
ncbi:MAG: alpha/beta fold hydrolase [Polyangiaceae bacterium]